MAAPVLPDQPWWSAVVLVALAVVLAAAARLAATGGSAAPLRVAAVAMAVAVVTTVFLLAGWSPALGTVVVCLVLLGAWPVFARLPALRPAGAWLTAGRFTGEVVLVLVALVVVTAVALVVWTLLARPPAPPFLAGLGDVPAWPLVAAMIGFSLVNSVWEEALYRGILQTELTAAWGAAPAIVVQAAAFGVAHLRGFPSGWVGALLAGVWGLMLGVLRHRGGGMAAPYVAHVCADATIAVLAVTLLLP